jgi:hypothetical protein
MQDRTVLNEIVKGVTERWAPVLYDGWSPFPYAELSAGDTFQDHLFWSALQAYLYLLASNGYLLKSDFVNTYTVSELFAEAGIPQGYRRVPGAAWPSNWKNYNDPAFVKDGNFCTRGDIIGPWLIEDVQKVCSVVKYYVLQGFSASIRTKTASAFRSIGHALPLSEAEWAAIYPDLQTEVAAAWPVSWTSGGTLAPGAYAYTTWTNSFYQAYLRATRVEYEVTITETRSWKLYVKGIRPPSASPWTYEYVDFDSVASEGVWSVLRNGSGNDTFDLIGQSNVPPLTGVDWYEYRGYQLQYAGVVEPEFTNV